MNTTDATQTPGTTEEPDMTRAADDRRTAVIVVDVQDDFVTGSLAVAGGAQVARDISAHLAAFDYDAVVATADWHTEQTEEHFAPDGEEPNFVTTWPVHCMAGDHGSDLYDELELPAGTPLFKKGQLTASYSGFDGVAAIDGVDTDLTTYLRDAGINEVIVVGLAFDHCVKATALDAAAAGFETLIIEDLSAAVAEATEAQARDELTAAGVTIAPAATLAF